MKQGADEKVWYTLEVLHKLLHEIREEEYYNISRNPVPIFQVRKTRKKTEVEVQKELRKVYQTAAKNILGRQF